MAPAACLPEFRGEDTAEEAMLAESRETGVAKDGGVVGEAGDAEAGEQAEGEIEGADEQGGGDSKGAARGDAEVGDDPEGVGGEVGAEGGEEGLELGRREAVEDEVGGDEVEGGVGLESGGEGVGVAEVGLLYLEAWGEGVTALGEELEHAGAGVDGEGVEVGVGAQEGMEEAAVAVAEDEGVAGGEEIGEEVLAGAAEERTKGEEFEDAVGAGDAVEGHGG